MSEKTLDLSLIDISPDIINSVEKLQKLEQKLERDLEKVRSLKYQLLESEIDNTRKKVKMLEVNNVQMSNTGQLRPSRGGGEHNTDLKLGPSS